MGGGFGGKETQASHPACATALAARATGRPVKLRYDRDDDITITGKRHDYLVEYEVGFDAAGRIAAIDLMFASRCGFSADLSGPVNDRTVMHADNAYFLPAVRIVSHRCKTNTQSNTAFRGFGGPQGMMAIEYVLDEIARALDLDPLAVRRANFYGPGRDVTPYDMQVEDFVADRLFDELAASSDYAARRAAIRKWNAASPVVKRGIAMTPVKFGISFTATFYNQASALVHVYTDGSVLLNHGGTEMGQGLFTKVAQVVAHELGLDLDRVRVSAADTGKIPNASATAASSGSDLNGKAAQAAAAAIKARLVAFAAERFQVPPEAVRFAANHVEVGDVKRLTFGELARLAYLARVPLWASGFYKTPKIHYDPKTLKGRPVLLLRLRRRGVRGRDRHAHRRDAAPARRHPARRRPQPEPGDRPRPGRGRLRAGNGLAHDRGAVVERQRAADDARALHLQDPGGLRRARRLPGAALGAGRERRGQHPPLEGGGRAAADARDLRVPGDQGRGRCGVRIQGIAAAQCARDAGGSAPRGATR